MQKFSPAKAKTFEKTICRDAVGYHCSLKGVGSGLGGKALHPNTLPAIFNESELRAQPAKARLLRTSNVIEISDSYFLTTPVPDITSGQLKLTISTV